MNKKIMLLLLHFPVWVVAFFVSYFFGFDTYPGGTHTDYWLQTITMFIWALGSFYAFYSFLVPQYLEKGKIVFFGIYSGLFVVIFMPALQFSMAYGFRLTPDSLTDHFSQYGLFVWLFCAVITLFCGMLGLLYRFSIDWFNNLHLKNEIENIKLKSELKAIKSRLNPHFLFNTLNNIDTLIQTNPSKASTVLSMLSDLLRYVVYETENEKISIHKELETTAKYIELEKIRLLNPDAVSFTCAIDKDFDVPPMLFIPFIENAFKHSNLNQHNNTLSISFAEKNNELIFHCTNSIHTQENETKEAGVGLKLIRERLKLLYPNTHNLQITRSKDKFDVTLTIKLTDD